MIYCVDENFRKLRAIVSELKFNGFEVEVIRDADTAYNILQNKNPVDIDLVLLDVMLAASIQSNEGKYSRERTQNYHITGLMLLEDLMSINPDVFPKYAAYLTYASSTDLVKQISKSANDNSMEFIKRNDFNTAYELGNFIKNIISNLREK